VAYRSVTQWDRAFTPRRVDQVQQALQTALASAYTIESELAQGGMSRVFLAIETALGRRVVIKLLPPELAGALSIERFRREIQVLAALQHPHIVPLFAAGESGELLYYTMPFVEGESLRDHLRRVGRLPVVDALTITRGVVAALSYAHAHGILHRDIKPANILISDGEAVVTDFGVSRALSAAGGGRLTESGVAVGTLAYMSPEQVLGERGLDHRSDLYSLGCVLYEMLTGTLPFAGPSGELVMARRLSSRPESVSDHREEVPARLADLATRLLEPQPDARPQSAHEVLEVLDDVHEGLGAHGTIAGRGTVSTTLPGDASLHEAGLVRRLSGVLGKRAALVSGIAFAVVAATVWAVRQPPSDPSRDDGLVAVTPFTVLARDIDTIWSEGIADVLTRNLDGAGALRAVAQDVVMRHWTINVRSNEASAIELGRKTAARYVVFGTILPAGDRKVTVSAGVMDMADRKVLEMSKIKQYGESERIDALADSVSLALLRALGASGALPESRGSSLGAGSVSALKLFLAGEQFYRKGEWDSAVRSYDKAVSQDPAFALALRRLGAVLSWQRDIMDSTAREYLLRAGRLNRGLPTRDSLLVTADSLRASLTAFESDTGYWGRCRRLLATLNEARRLYTKDPEVWYALADAQFHYAYGPGQNVTDDDIFEAFRKAIALDPQFTPAYIHAVELAFALRGPNDGLRAARDYIALQPGDAEGAGIRAVAALGESGDRLVQIRGAIDSLSLDALYTMWQAIRRWPDSAETAVGLIRSAAEMSRAAAAKRRGTDDWFGQEANRRLLLMLQLAYRGHLDDAYRNLEHEIDARARLFSELALVGGGVPDSIAASVFSTWAVTGERYAPAMLPWLAAHGDTASLSAVLRRNESRATQSANTVELRDVRYRIAAARAYLALAGRDTVTALQLLGQLPDTLCLGCYVDRLTKGRLLAARGQYQDAWTVLNERLWSLLTPIEILFALERARVAERLGDTKSAIAGYSFVASVWANADASLRGVSGDARATAVRLSTRRPRSVATGDAAARPPGPAPPSTRAADTR